MILVVLAIFLAAATALFAVGMSLRDLSGTNRPNALACRLGIDGFNTDPPIGLEPMPPAGRMDRAFQHLLEKAGSRLTHSVGASLVLGSALLGAGVAFIVCDHFLAAAAGLVAGGAVPIVWWAIMAWRRRIAIVRALPETLDLLADSVRSGRSFEQAVAMVAADTRGPLADEFAYCAAQLRVGHVPSAVIERMVRRVPVAEFKMFAVAVLVHRQTGGNLAVVTERLATAARDRQQFGGHLAAVTAGSRLSAIGLVVGSMAGAAALMWIEPEYLGRFYTHRLGPMLLTLAGVLQFIGVVWLWRVLRVRY